ncbi:MAG TPA: hypothetical protein VM869_11495, partial [Enhygromyxa sp.]|nr:hypothetical protein [Enhygromyxa sp.]
QSPDSMRPWLVACNQAGVSGASHYGFGTLWMRYDRRGDFSRTFTRLAEAAGCEQFFTWDAVRRGASQRLAARLVEHFFETKGISFHCLVVEKSIVDLARHRDDLDLAQRKHFTMLLANKIKATIKKRGPEQEFRVWVSPIPSRYAKAAEAIEVISGNIIAECSGCHPRLSVNVRSSVQTPAIQLCDVLLGAVINAWNDDASNQEKRTIEQQIAGCLGWPDLRADTSPKQKKFNIWKFHDPVRQPVRGATTRPTRID